jgi:hypothetical protein
MEKKKNRNMFQKVYRYHYKMVIPYNHTKISELIFAPNLLEGYTESFFEVDYRGNLSYLNISCKFFILSSLSIE